MTHNRDPASIQSRFVNYRVPRPAVKLRTQAVKVKGAECPLLVGSSVIPNSEPKLGFRV